MIMNTQQRFWTFNSLVCAFIDLFIAYFLLFGSTIAFFAANFLQFFGFTLPDPNSQFKTLLVDYPTDKISSLQFSLIRKFPFDSVFEEKFHNCNVNDALNLDRGDRFRELEGEASCSSKLDAKKLVTNENAGIRVQKERGFDMKGKGGLRGGFRRRRKASFDSGKHSSVSSSTNWITSADQHTHLKEHTGAPEGSSLLSGFNTDYYEAEDPMVVKSDSTHPQDIVFNDADATQKRIPVNEADKDKMIVLLNRELEEEQNVRAALYVELEKERNAAATAADEAMSMILRLQEEKASIEMESRQYQRMIEEKSAYDEEEMNILKEIVLRREREKHFLEKEVEAYRQMNHVENDQFYGNNNQNSRGYEDVDFSLQQEGDRWLPEKTIATVGEEKDLKMESGEDASNETDLHVYDVHVIDNKSEKSNGNEKQQPASSSEMSVSSGLPPINSKSSLRRNSTSAIDNERTKLDTEVDWLRERLRIVQEGREKLNFSIDNREKESLQLQLLEDIARQLQEIRMLTQPRTSRQASLPLPSSKGVTKKRRCRSASTGPAKSS